MTLTNPDTVRAFLEALHEGATAACSGLEQPGLLQLTRIHPSGGGTIVSGRFMIGDVDEMTKAVLADAEAGFNCYVEPRTIRRDAAKRGSIEDTRAVFAFVIDRDAYSGRAGQEFEDPTWRVETSPGSGHDWYLLKRAISAEEAQVLGASLRAVTGADSATGKATQPYRVAGTPNFPNAKKQALGRKPCRTNFANGGPLYSADDLRGLIGDITVARPTGQSQSPFQAASTGHLSSRVQRLVCEPVTATTDRSVAFCAAVRAAVEDGMTATDLEAFMREHPEGCASKYLSPRDRLQQEIARVWDPHTVKVAERDALGGTAAERLSRPAQPGASRTAAPVEIFWHGTDYSRLQRPWLVKDMIPQTGTGLASGQWGTGKTFAALDLALSVMTGMNFAGREVCRRGAVLFIAAEGAVEIPIRLQGAVDQKLRPFALAAAAAGNPLDVALDRLPFAWIEDVPSLKHEATFERLVATAEAVAKKSLEIFGLPLVLNIVDTLAASADFDDANDAAEGQRIMGRMNTLSRRTGAFSLAADHFGKVIETGTRGTSAKEAAADVVLALLADRDVAGNISNTRLAIRKLRGGATGAEIPFDLKVVENAPDQTTCIIEWRPDQSPKAAPTSAKERWPKSLKIFRSAMHKALAESGTVRRPFPDGPSLTIVPDSAVRTEFMAAYPADGDDEKRRLDAKRVAFARALKTARERDLICSREIGGIDYLWLVDQQDKSHTHADGPDTT